MSLHASIAHCFSVLNNIPLSGGSMIYPFTHWRTCSHFLSNLTQAGLHTDSLTLLLLNPTASLSLHLLATTPSLITWPPGHGNHLAFPWPRWPPLSLPFNSSSFWPLMWNSPHSYIQPPTWHLHLAITQAPKRNTSIAELHLASKRVYPLCWWQLQLHFPVGRPKAPQSRSSLLVPFHMHPV